MAPPHLLERRDEITVHVGHHTCPGIAPQVFACVKLHAAFTGSADPVVRSNASREKKPVQLPCRMAMMTI
jgi:hypothetical protein